MQRSVRRSVCALVKAVRLVCLELAGMGATPHRWAKAASERIRSGLSPAVVKSWLATSTPTPGRVSSSGAVVVPVV